MEIKFCPLPFPRSPFPMKSQAVYLLCFCNDFAVVALANFLLNSWWCRQRDGEKQDGGTEGTGQIGTDNEGQAQIRVETKFFLLISRTGTDNEGQVLGLIRKRFFPFREQRILFSKRIFPILLLQALKNSNIRSENSFATILLQTKQLQYYNLISFQAKAKFRPSD